MRTKQEILEVLDYIFYNHSLQNGNEIPRSCILHTSVFNTLNMKSYLLMDLFHSPILREDQCLMMNKQILNFAVKNCEDRRLSDGAALACIEALK